jgi:hypothetical protein
MFLYGMRTPYMQDEDKRRFYVEMMDAARLEAERELKKKKRDQVCSKHAVCPFVRLVPRWHAYGAS